MNKINNIGSPYLIGFLGGYIFYICYIPLAWILGPMTFLIIWRSLFTSSSQFSQPSILKNGSFIILGISFGLSFTKETFLLVGPYILPFLGVTILLIIISVVNGVLISKVVNIDRNTSIFASIPGGLTEMVAASESVQANSSFVTIFQTVRLLTVVFLVPFTIQHMFEPNHFAQTAVTLNDDPSIFSFGWY
ncbi:MAG TPA: AbrB family transcriptional regulator, partial [Metabacillus sp.]|nr:AbrB family transcriptional regulator [Metabacillus sp.]